MKVTIKVFLSLICLLTAFMIISINVFAVEVGSVLASPETGWVRINDNNPAISWAGTYYSNVYVDCYNGDWSRIASENSTITYTFTGTDIRILACTDASVCSENIQVTLDGTVITNLVPSNRVGSSQGKTIIFESLNLPNQNHTIILKLLDNNHLILDAIDTRVQQIASPSSYTYTTTIVNQTYTPGNINTSTTQSKTFNIPQATLGQFVEVSFSNDLQGIVLSGYVQSAGVVNVLFINQTGTTVNLAQGTLRIKLTGLTVN